ncbi:MAG: hypothetical protein OEN56_01435 [Gemmatimonadota bacterium]|nr:hypothetical protein [Gemmatimonadota bacterium]
MDWEYIAPMIVSIVLALTVGGVLILRPLALRVSELLALYARDRDEGVEAELGQVRDLLDSVDARLRLMEERQDFTERLLSSGKNEISED